MSVRARHGVASIDRDSSARALLEVLRRGESIGVLIDQHTNVAGAYVPFFDRPAYFQPTGKGCAFRCTYCGGSYDAQGITAGRLESIGYGQDRPVVENDTRAGRGKNRRVEIVLTEGS